MFIAGSGGKSSASNEALVIPLPPYIMKTIEAKAREKELRVRNTLTAIFEILVEGHRMEPHEVGPFMVDAGNAVAGIEGYIYLSVFMQEIERRLGRSLFDD
jgi:hypothetical protein